MVSKEEKSALIKQFGKNEKDSGSIEAQIAILTLHIEKLKLHFEVNKKDLHSKRGFLNKINHRKSLLEYLKRTNFESYSKLIKELNIRK